MHHVSATAIAALLGSTLLALTAAAMLLLARSAAAQPNSFPVEPSMVGVEDAFPVPKGRTELELNYFYSTANSAFDSDGNTVDRGSNALHIGSFSAKHGILNSLDVGIGIFGAYSRDVDEPERNAGGMGDLFVGAKWRFFGEGDDGLHLAYRPGLLIPVGEQDDDENLSPGLGFWILEQTLVATLVHERWVGGVDASFFLPLGNRNGVRGFPTANLGIGYQLTPWLKPEVELNYVHEFMVGPADAKVLAATAGLILNLSEAIRADLGVRHGFYGRNAGRRLSVSANLLWAF